MITIISGSNRLGNQTHKVATYYYERLRLKAPDTQFFSLEDLPTGFLYPHMYESKHPDFLAIEKKFLIPADKFVFVLPEYNGSFPGVLKAFIDACEVKACFQRKKAALVGISSGKSGNQRGLDHLTAVLHHLRMLVSPDRLYLSHVEEELNEAGHLFLSGTLQRVEKQMDAVLTF